jgi:hypothetical protein
MQNNERKSCNSSNSSTTNFTWIALQLNPGPPRWGAVSTVGIVGTNSPWPQNPKVLHRIHNSPPPARIPSQVNPLRTPPSNLPMIYSDPILPSTSRSSEWSLSFGLSYKNLVLFSLLSHVCHMHHPPHSPWLDLPNDIWGLVQIMKTSLCNFLHSPVTSSLLGPNILLRTALRQLQSMHFL